MAHQRSALVKCTAVHIGVGQEFSYLVAMGVIVQHSEALVTEETWAAWSKLVVGGQPSGKSPRCKTYSNTLKMLHMLIHLLQTFRWRCGKLSTSVWRPCACEWGVDTASYPGSLSCGLVFKIWTERVKKGPGALKVKWEHSFVLYLWQWALPLLALLLLTPKITRLTDGTTITHFLLRGNLISYKVLWMQSNHVWQRSAFFQGLVQHSHKNHILWQTHHT